MDFFCKAENGEATREQRKLGDSVMLQQNEYAAAGRTDGGDRATRELPAMIDVQAVAGLLDCSTRHVYRLSDSKRMPRPVKLGALVRWPRAQIEGWISQGCPSCHTEGASHE